MLIFVDFLCIDFPFKTAWKGSNPEARAERIYPVISKVGVLTENVRFCLFVY